MVNSFTDRFKRIYEHKPISIMILIAPNVLQMPLPMKQYDDPFLPFSKIIIQATHDLVCGYIFDFSSFLSIGAAGAVALERSIAYVPPDCLTIIHGNFADESFCQLLDETAFNADALTIADNCALTVDANPAKELFRVVNTEQPPLNAIGQVNIEAKTLSYQNIQMNIFVDDLVHTGQSSLSTEDFQQRFRTALMEWTIG